MTAIEKIFEEEMKHFPVLITRADVLDHFAERMSTLAKMLTIGDRLSKDSAKWQLHTSMAAVWKSKIPAADLQISAAESAAELLRHLAREDRILACRAAAASSKREPSRG